MSIQISKSATFDERIQRVWGLLSPPFPSIWGYVIQCKIAYTSGTKVFLHPYTLANKTCFGSIFFSNASSEAILKFKMAALFSLFEQ